jgi:formamidopyrimidine-DNA glycosylase
LRYIIDARTGLELLDIDARRAARAVVPPRQGGEMPELPEVETMVLGLRESILGQRVRRVRVFCERLMGQVPSASLRKVQGGRVIGLSRKGKFLLFHLSNGSLLVFHLRMTGKLLLVPSARPLTKRDRLRLDFSDWDWALTFEDTRRFGSLDILHAWEPGDGLLRELGPDALLVDLADFRELLAGSRRPLKALLLDQRVIAGLGNIYVDESLHRAGIHPRTPADAVTATQSRRLHTVMRLVLRKAINCRGSSVSDYRDSHGRAGTYQKHHRVYQRRGEPCTTCGEPIEHIRVGGRGTHLCPACQKDPTAAGAGLKR